MLTVNDRMRRRLIPKFTIEVADFLTISEIRPPRFTRENIIGFPSQGYRNTQELADVCQRLVAP